MGKMTNLILPQTILSLLPQRQIMTATSAGYRLSPLVARSPSLLRPDVWFFVLLYASLSLLPLIRSGRGPALLYRLSFGLSLSLHVLTFFASHWSISVQRFLGFTPAAKADTATHVLVVPPPTAGCPEIVPLQRVPELDPDSGAVTFNTLSASYQKLVFSARLVANDALSFSPRTYPTALPLKHYAVAAGLESESHQQASSLKYGANDKEIPLPTFLSCLLAQLVAPFFIFQCLCCALWCLDEYWYYAIFTLFMLVVFEATMALQRIKSLQRLRQTLPPPTAFLAYRGRQWAPVLSTELLVGDIISLTRPPPNQPSDRRRRQTQPPTRQVPADLLLLSGHLVVNEAMLTGESVPQQKEPLDVELGGDEPGKETLDVEDGGRHVRHLVSAGTVVVDHQGDKQQQQSTQTGRTAARSPPDGGCVCYVLRTGFGTSQGRLLRGMAFGSKESSANTWDTFAFIAGLLLFAIVAAGVVVKEGMKDKERNRFRLLLHAIMILTSVVPPELPMELSLAVTNSLKSLMQINIFCTEPFRIPMGGRITTCCFDKTGTLTSDETILNSIIVSQPTVTDEKSPDPAAEFPELISVDLSALPSSLPFETARVLAACQSLTTQSDGVIIGDPLEQACLTSARWILAAGGGIVYPPLGSGAKPVEILHRYGFESRLKRMSVVARDTEMSHAASQGPLMLLCKGAPETMKGLLVASSVPPVFDAVSTSHMSKGQRVLCLAYRTLDDLLPPNLRNVAGVKALGREKLESNLIFAGLVTFDCPLKVDSNVVIKELIASQHDVVMITGDAVLTAAEVARKVGIISSESDNTYELVVKEQRAGDLPDLSGTDLIWKNMSSDGFPSTIPYKVGNEAALRKIRKSGSCLCISGDVLMKLATQNVGPSKAETLEARLTAPRKPPEPAGRAKAKLAIAKSESHFSIQATVTTNAASAAGVDANVDDGGENESSASANGEDKKNELLLPEVLDKLRHIIPYVSVFARHAPRQKEAIVAALNACGKFTMMCGDGTNDVGALKQAHVGISLISVPAIEKKKREASDGLKKIQREERRLKKAAAKRIAEGEAPDEVEVRSASSTSSLQRYVQQMKEADEDLDYVALGDASVASPFTSRGTSIACCKRVILQGRCTLVTMLQIYKILGVNCLVTGLNLSRQTIIGVKQGDTQLTVLSIAVALLFFMVSLAKPLGTLSPRRPPASVLCTQALLSIALQFSVHLLAIWTTTKVALPFLDPDDPSHTPDGVFTPTALNTASFLVYASITVTTFMVNYRGRPYMESLSENKILLRGLQFCFFLLVVSATEVFPPLNEALGLSPMPSGIGIEGGDEQAVDWWAAALCNTLELKGTVCLICVLDTLGVLLIEKRVRSFFGDGVE